MTFVDFLRETWQDDKAVQHGIKPGDRVRTRKSGVVGTAEKIVPQHPTHSWTADAVFFRTDDGKRMVTPLSNVTVVSENLDHQPHQMKQPSKSSMRLWYDDTVSGMVRATVDQMKLHRLTPYAASDFARKYMDKRLIGKFGERAPLTATRKYVWDEFMTQMNKVNEAENYRVLHPVAQGCNQ